MISKKEMAAWLRGFADGEGYVTALRTKNNVHCSRVIYLSNTEPILIKKASEYLTILGITHRIKKRIMVNKKPIQQVFISNQENLVKWQKLIGFNSELKSQRLKEVIDAYGIFKYNKKKIVNLKAQGLSYEKIARKAKTSPSTVKRVLDAMKGGLASD